MAMSTLTNVLLYSLTGCLSGLMSGLLGVGGGIIIIPSLLMIFHHTQLVSDELSMHMAAASSLAVVMFTSQAAIRAHHRLNNVLWGVYYRLMPGLVAGTIFGVLLAQSFSSEGLKTFFSLIILLIATNMLFNKKISSPRQFPSNWVNRLVSFVIGAISGLIGIGGGLFLFPYLTYCGIDERKITAVSALGTLTVSVLGTLALVLTGFKIMNLPAYSTGYVYWPAVFCVGIPSALMAPQGVKLIQVLPLRLIRGGFIVLMVVTAVSMLL
jgi:uncharacterized membrane protein YfcA